MVGGLFVCVYLILGMWKKEILGDFEVDGNYYEIFVCFWDVGCEREGEKGRVKRYVIFIRV